MWYTYLNRNQHYLRSYRTHNLWFKFDAMKARTPRVHSFTYGLLKRIAKTYSGVRITWIITVASTVTLSSYCKLTILFSPFFRLVTSVSSTVALSSPSLKDALDSPPSPLKILKTTSSTIDSSLSSPRTSSVTIPDSCLISIFSLKVCSTLSSLSNPFSTTMTSSLASKLRITKPVSLVSSPKLMYAT
jgi:hypothetical protein